MPATLILSATAMGLVLIVLALVVVGIRQEPPERVPAAGACSA